MTDINDLDTIDKVLSGDVDAFSEIVSKYWDRVFNYVYYRVNNYDEAIDMTQDIFVMTYESLSTYRRESKFYTWMFSIMSNYCKNYRKKMSRYKTVSINRDKGQDDLEFLLKDKRENPEQEIVDNDSLRIVKEELYNLPEDYRDILVLRDIDGVSYNEIAKIVGIKLSNVKVRIHRGREMLRQRLSERGLL